MKIITKKIKYENNIFFIQNSNYQNFYFYFAQKTKKNTLYTTRKLLQSYNIDLIHYNKQWQNYLFAKHAIKHLLFTTSSGLWIGLSKKKVINEEFLQISKLKTEPLILINTYLPNQNLNVYRYNLPFIGLKAINFFSKTLINQYLTKIKIFNTYMFYSLFLIQK